MIKVLKQFIRSKYHLIQLTFSVRKFLQNNRELQELAAKYKDFDAIVLLDRPAGFFSIYFQAMCSYLIASINHQSIFFIFKCGPYYSKLRSESSWWNYFFEGNGYSIDRKNEIQKNHGIICSNSEQCELADFGETLPRKLGFLLSQQFHLNKSIEQKIDDFVNCHFRNSFIIGLHYRGTDKVSGMYKESVRLDYEFIDTVLESILKRNFPFRLFVATDEEDLIEYLSRKTN